ncbi:MAG: hypothetical protein A3C44_03295 [Gammaproteobacteria bacterium RIFCSPHIGHO2_02_FULL_39_13]|nr:MAG: hypothetical protein A3C44_03295 [Gammaproteobacteria bacterium RIFCSPHIGHO2_02_FULL_39_13]OGT48555.1 MAG: hypothetical protein A3E53_04185 [Gammaproteobacteria bacterium RIFCSPHIGHO2_12_FULL_39_24]
MHSAIRQKVINFIFELNSQNDLPHWSIANEKILYTIALDQTPVWGPRQKTIFYMMQLAYKLKISDWIIFLLGLSKIISMLYLTRKNKVKNNVSGELMRVFAGFGAASEEYLYQKYKLRANDLPLRINWVTQEGIAVIGKMNVLKLLLALAHHAFGYSKKIKQSSNKRISSNAPYFLTGCAMNIGQYVYYYEFFQLIKKKGVQEVAFSAPDIAAFAATDAKIRTIFLQHGLLALSILFPKFDRMNVITVDEEHYLKRLWKNSHIVRMYKESSKNKNDIVMILSPSRHEHVVAIESLIAWMTNKGFQVVIRLTPRVPKEVIDCLHQDISNFIFDDLLTPLELSFEKWQPKFVASWTSTGLAIALQLESLPISLHDPIKGDEYWERIHPSPLDNMIYPMRNRVLFWPHDQEKIEMAVQSENNYRSQISQLKSYQDCI